MNELVGDCRYLVDGGVEGLLVRVRRLVGTAKLSHELQGGGADFVLGRRRLEVGECLDVPAHGVGPRGSVFVDEIVLDKRMYKPGTAHHQWPADQALIDRL